MEKTYTIAWHNAGNGMLLGCVPDGGDMEKEFDNLPYDVKAVAHEAELISGLLLVNEIDGDDVVYAGSDHGSLIDENGREYKYAIRPALDGSEVARRALENQEKAEKYLEESCLPDPWANSNDLWDLESSSEIEAEPVTGAAESFERDRKIYVPEERETVCDESGRIWSRWDKQKGGGQAFSGRAFLPSDASENEIVSRFKVLDYDGGEE